MNKDVKIYELWEAIKELQETESLELVFRLVVVENGNIIRDKTLFGDINLLMVHKWCKSPYVRLAKIDEEYNVEFQDAFQADKVCKWIICTDFDEISRKVDEKRLSK